MRTSLFSLVLLGSCPALLAQAVAGGAPIGVPRLIAQIEDRAAPIELETLDATVQINGFLAETTLVMTFYNRDPRLLEGEFLLSLPDGATVSGYGLDVDGLLVDGVVVEKQKARIAFERETRREIDPGLIEWLGGNLFRTRVYPIAGESRRTIKVQYVAELEFRRREPVYRLPLAAYPALARLRLRVEVIRPEREPVIAHHPFSQLEPRLEGDVFVAEAVEDDLRATEDFEVRLGTRRQQVVVVEEMGAGTYVFAAADFGDRPDPGGGGRLRARPERLALFWDASFSRHRGDHREALRVVAALLSHWRPLEVVLVVFRDQAQAPMTFAVGDGSSADLLATLDDLVYDGATGWRDLAVPAGFEADAALVFSDGRISFGGHELPELGVPAYVFNSASDGDARVLRHLAESSGGAYFDLTGMTSQSIVRELSTVPVTLRAVSVERGVVREIFAPVGRPVRGPTVVTGLLASEEARLSLAYAAGDGDPQRVPITLRARPGGALVSRFWAQQKLARLALFPDQNREAILALGREHGLVTPATSLVVLENLGQYLEYQIEPPASLPEMRREYHELVQDLRLAARESLEHYLQQLREDWQDYVAWSEASYDFPPPGAYELDRSRPEPELAAPSPSELSPEPERIEPDPFADRPPVPQTVRGVLRDDYGDPLPGTQVRLESEALTAAVVLYSGADGSYQTPVLTPGRYTLSCDLEGFSTVERGFWLDRGAALRLDVVLSTAVAEEIMVTAGAIDEQAGEGTGEILLKPWTPDMPYLKALRAAPAGGLYEAYLEQRETYASSPAFYVDCSRFFFDRGMARHGLRIASTLLELGVEEPRLIRAAANLFLQARAWGRAVMLFQRLGRLRPELPQSNRDLAVALILRGQAQEDANPTAAREDYQRAASLLRQVALEPWGAVPSPLQVAYIEDGRFEEIGRIALVEYGWARRKLQALSDSGGEPLAEVDPSWVHLPATDLRIVLTWADEFADMDLWVIEPSGEKVYFSNPRSVIGGLLSEDCTTGLGPESYVLKQAMPGTYRILVDFYTDSSPDLLGPVTVQTLIVTGFGREDEQVQLHSVRLETQEDTVEIGSVTIGQ